MSARAKRLTLKHNYFQLCSIHNTYRALLLPLVITKQVKSQLNLAFATLLKFPTFETYVNIC